MKHLRDRFRFQQTDLSYLRCSIFASRPGQVIELLARRLTEMFPNSKLVRRIWAFTLPF